MKQVLFIDRDGTLIVEPPDNQIDSLEKLEFVPGVFTWLGRIARESDYELVMVTNQDGLGTDDFPEHTFWPAHEKLLTALRNEGISFASVHIDRSLPSDKANTRKPGTGMLVSYFSPEYDLPNSYVIGDRLTDMELARNLGCQGLMINPGLFDKAKETGLDAVCRQISPGWRGVYEYLVLKPRTAAIRRDTLETKIELMLNLDGTGHHQVRTGLSFLDHMLAQLSRHGGYDIQVNARGDLHVDEHHVMEDIGIALGMAFDRALGGKRGINRYGFLLPMDDCQAQVSVDFGGRPWLVWRAEFHRERIGDVPTEMFHHFFKSFSDHARCNLNISAEGTNEHHKIEAIFKACARVFRQATARTDSLQSIPTTKGVL